MTDHPGVPILRIPFSSEDKELIASSIAQVLSSGILTMGPRTAEFEEKFAAYVGAKYCVATSNGTSALEVILRALGIRAKSVVVPTNTFLATALAVIHSGNRVIFADADPETLCLDPEDLRRRIRDDTAAVIIVHVGGIITPALREIQHVCAEFGIPLIEDCAHAHGCDIDGSFAGTLGVAGAFSFFPTKVLVMGEGGAITTNDQELQRRARIICNQGKDPDLQNHISELGHNFRMSEISAVLGIQQLDRADALVRERRRIAARYDELLGASEWFKPVRVSKGVRSSYYKYVTYLPDGCNREKLKRLLKERYRVSLTGEVYADPCHAEPIWQRYTLCGAERASESQRCVCWPACAVDMPTSDFPGAARLSASHVCLPVYPGLTNDDVAWVVQALTEARALC
jgi:dTDP-4-amino-4,6-dideoxygalactose transaminase